MDANSREREVVLKLMKHQDQFQREIDQREGLDPNFVIPVLCSSARPELAGSWESDLSKVPKWKDYRFGIVMPAAQVPL